MEIRGQVRKLAGNNVQNKSLLSYNYVADSAPKKGLHLYTHIAGTHSRNRG